MTKATELDAALQAPEHGTPSAAGTAVDAGRGTLDVGALPMAPSHEPAVPVAQRTRRSTGNAAQPVAS